MLALGLLAGCGQTFPPPPAPLFTTPLVIHGRSVGSAVIDTGGAYELMLQENFGLNVLGQVEVLAFSGKEFVDITDGFPFNVGGVDAMADAALVGISVCDCNGLGFYFFRKTGTVLAIDFDSLTASFVDEAPRSDPVAGDETSGVGLAAHRRNIVIPFERPPLQLPHFDSAFLSVQITLDGTTRRVLGLLDTGTNSTLMRRGLFDSSSTPQSPASELPLDVGALPIAVGHLTLQALLGGPDRVEITIHREELGTVAVNVGLFDTEGLPDIILGTDVMRAWSPRWFFKYRTVGGEVTVAPARTAVGTAESLGEPE